MLLPPHYPLRPPSFQPSLTIPEYTASAGCRQEVGVSAAGQAKAGSKAGSGHRPNCENNNTIRNTEYGVNS